MSSENTRCSGQCGPGCEVEREYTHWELAARKAWEDNMIVTNYLWWPSVSSEYRAMVQVHMRKVQWGFKQVTHRVHRDAPSLRSRGGGGDAVRIFPHFFHIFRAGPLVMFKRKHSSGIVL